MRGMYLFLAMVVSLVLANACWATVVVPLIDFDNAADFNDNFTSVLGTVSYDSSDDGGVGAGGFLAGVGSSHNTIVYDTDGAIGGASDIWNKCTVDFDFKVGTAGAGIGVYALASASDTRLEKHWLFFQIDDGAVGGDRARWFSWRNITTAGGGYTKSDQSEDTTLTLNEWIHARVEVDVIEDGVGDKFGVMTLSAYDSQTVFDASTLKFTGTHTFDVPNNTVAPSEIGVSMLSATSSLDNFTISTPTVPEPSTLALLVTGLIGLLAYAWRKRK